MKKTLIAAVLVLAACNRNTNTTSTASTDTTPVVAAKAAVPLPVTCTPAAVEEVRKGFALSNELRQPEAEERYKAAVAADPKCWIAMAHLGLQTPGAAGTGFIDDALAGAKDLPEGERLLIQYIHHNRHGETAKRFDTAKLIVVALPDSWEAHHILGQEHFFRRQWTDAIAAFRAAAELAPQQGSIHNDLGYAYLQQEKIDDAVASFKRYTELAPNEPNGFDSYGEALLAAGKYDESEAAFKKSIELKPAFGIAWQGIAMGKMLRGDWTAAQEALTKAIAAEPRAQDKLAFRSDAASALFLAGKTADALKAYETIEKDAVASKVPGQQIAAPLHRAWIQVRANKHNDALATIAAAEKKIATVGIPEGNQRDFKVFANVLRLRAQTGLGMKAHIQKTLGEIQELTAFDPNDPHARSTRNWAEGHVAFGAGDSKTAIEKFSACERDDVECRVDLVAAYEKAGDKAGADRVKAEILGRKMRNIGYVWAHHRLTPATGTGG